MKIAIGADHAGFPLKQALRVALENGGHEVLDFGPDSETSCDYPDYAAAVARDVARHNSDRGILVCSTGVGMAIAANKVGGVRAAMGTSVDEVRLTREHNDSNVLTLGARYTDLPGAVAMMQVFLETDFAGGRHARRVAKIARIEQAERAWQAETGNE